MASTPDAIDDGISDIRPVVSTASNGNWGMWAFFALLAVGGFALFNALSSGREAATVASTLTPREASPGARIAAPAPIALPRRFLEPAERREVNSLAKADQPPPASYAPIPLAQIAPPAYVPPPAPNPPEVQNTSRVVFETSSRDVVSDPGLSADSESDRVTAGRFSNPSLTVPKGTVIAAVLETAIDSTRGGATRALVQHDVYSFDGTRVLIPRGTRLYGQYEADLQSGQNRAAITWEQLLRPDGVTMNLVSPASDPLGRAGVKGKVDSKFFQRFGGAILQSILDVGVGLATTEATDGVVVALPGSTQNLQIQQQGEVRPTLKVRHGASVSVFVARDLDFSAVDR